MEVSSRGPNLTYSSSSLDPQGFKSRLQISIGSGNVGGIVTSRTRPNNMSKSTGSQFFYLSYSDFLHFKLFYCTKFQIGLPGNSVINCTSSGKTPQYKRFTCNTSAPNTPSASMAKDITSSSSLPVTPTENLDLGVDEIDSGKTNQYQYILNQGIPLKKKLMKYLIIIKIIYIILVDDSKKNLLLEQLERKDRLSRALNNEIKKLEEMKKEVENFSKPVDPNISPQVDKVKKIHDLFLLI